MPTVLALRQRSRPERALVPEGLICLEGHAGLSLLARRAIVLLWHQACRQGLGAGKGHLIELSALCADTHKGTGDALRAVGEIAGATLGYRTLQGVLEPVRLLGRTDLEDPARAGGTLRYEIDEGFFGRLAPRTPCGVVDLTALRALSSKYAVPLFLWGCLMTTARRKVPPLSLAELRALLGVPGGAYPEFAEFNRAVLQRALQEINAVSPLCMGLQPFRVGRRVEMFELLCGPDGEGAAQAAEREARLPRAGRQARRPQGRGVNFALASTAKDERAERLAQRRAAIEEEAARTTWWAGEGNGRSDESGD